MREEWIRGAAALAPDRAAVEHLLRRSFKNASLAGIEPTAGGLANTNLKLRFSDETGDRVASLRYWQRDRGEARKEVALLRLVRSRVPTPKVLAFGDADPIFGLPYAVLEWIEGERLDLAAARLGETALRQLGRSVGAALAGVHSFVFERQGFFGQRLRVPAGVDFGREGFLQWLHTHMLLECGGARLGAALAADLLNFVERKGYALNCAWARRECLTHADFNGSNVLVNPNGDHLSWSVDAVLDWEFAFAGGPAFDFGNLLRPPLGATPGYMEGIAAGYLAAGGALPEGWRAAALVADLMSWAESINRENATAGLIHDARKMIREIVDANLKGDG